MLSLGRVLASASLILVLTAATACASRAAPPIDRPGAPLGERWASSQNRDHPLAGKIWDTHAKAFVTARDLEAAAVRARFVLLGEVHDNPDHHLLQARIVRAVTASGRRPALAFEMLDETQQPAIDRVARTDPHDLNAIRDAVGWDQSGWPPFKLYRPIFEAGLEAGLPIVAANLPRETIRQAARAGAETLPPEVRARIERQGPLSKKLREELRVEMAESHCGELPESMLDPLIVAQRARDAELATRMVDAATADGTILITGAGHVRRDRGVPSYLSPDEASGGVVAVGFYEVSPDRPQPADYDATDPAQFDFVVFTPGAEREDPCEKLREQMRGMHRHAPVGTQNGGAQL